LCSLISLFVAMFHIRTILWSWSDVWLWVQSLHLRSGLGKHVPPKRRYSSTRLNGVITQENKIRSATVMIPHRVPYCASVHLFSYKQRLGFLAASRCFLAWRTLKSWRRRRHFSRTVRWLSTDYTQHYIPGHKTPWKIFMIIFGLRVSGRWQWRKLFFWTWRRVVR
jgi:hypothetical protein